MIEIHKCFEENPSETFIELVALDFHLKKYEKA
jgi:hypothetical protein